LSDVDVFS